jgi:hypothetical protein
MEEDPMVDLPSQPLAEIDPAFEEVALETGELDAIPLADGHTRARSVPG